VSRSDLPKRIISEVYSRTAGSLYEPVVVRGTFRVAAHDLERLVAEQARRAIAHADGAPILDVPIGTGHFTTQFAHAHNGVIVGVDIAHGMVVQATKAARAAGSSNVVAVRADAHALPFAGAAFGAIMCTNGLQVMPGLRRTLAELHRVLRPGGSLQVSIVNLPLGSLLPGGASERLPTMFRSRASMALAIERAGFTVVDVMRSRLATLVEARRPTD
jgi:ubiquinone/menaquinone biosynthesis C-methylase UbiE